MPEGSARRSFVVRFIQSFRRTGLLMAVVFTLINSVFLFLVGVYQSVHSMVVFLTDRSPQAALTDLIKTTDIFLAALVMMLLALGLYDLFVVQAEDEKACWRGFSSTLDELKNSLAKLVIIILIIAFLELVLSDLEDLHSYEVLIVPVGILFIGLGLNLTRKS